MKRRPDWIVCVATNVGKHHALHGKTWCGLRPVGFRFTDVTHATVNGFNGGRLVPCPECLVTIIAALKNGHEDADRDRYRKQPSKS